MFCILLNSKVFGQKGQSGRFEQKILPFFTEFAKQDLLKVLVNEFFYIYSFYSLGVSKNVRPCPILSLIKIA